MFRRKPLDFSCNASQRQTLRRPWPGTDSTPSRFSLTTLIREYPGAPSDTLFSGALFLALFVPSAHSARGGSADAESDFVDIKSVDPTIVVDLRYAGPNNFTRRPLYPPGMPAMVRFSVAQRLVVAQKFLKKRGYGLKIWDAYRPKAAQEQLWEATGNHVLCGGPKRRHRLHAHARRGGRRDAGGSERARKSRCRPSSIISRPPRCLIIRDADPVVRSNLKLLQKAMAQGRLLWIADRMVAFLCERLDELSAGPRDSTSGASALAKLMIEAILRDSAAARISSRSAQSLAGLRIGRRLVRLDRGDVFGHSRRPGDRARSYFRLRRLGLAGRSLRRSGGKQCPRDGGRRRPGVAEGARASRRGVDLRFLRPRAGFGRGDFRTEEVAEDRASPGDRDAVAGGRLVGRGRLHCVRRRKNPPPRIPNRSATENASPSRAEIRPSDCLGSA